MTRLLSILALCLIPMGASAQSLVFSLGATDFHESDAGDPVQGGIDVLTRPFRSLGPVDLELGVAATVDFEGNAWLGAGLAATADLGALYYVEGSVMPGWFHASDDALESDGTVRSLIGVGRRFGPATSVALAVSHRSALGSDDRNGAHNDLTLRLRREF
ncbi:hypothetical protein OCGS_0234 [Oceaniovalibus guishaninsula JLT2003]|uniref:Lipid A 3-O-deacylase (PagL) n=1 Tax=Oceaniovalibus guishaninsula JLT2003 TaxID=1231392 RepID=K2HGP9_9RHOB|nr:acyloxyacyl hydrolase [Oceaniovalibus guishaninsula]EKE45617.1 hypothetical protein OCGS_0234 [Oceaniovalibus guishaninsula JLT2003]